MAAILSSQTESIQRPSSKVPSSSGDLTYIGWSRLSQNVTVDGDWQTFLEFGDDAISSYLWIGCAYLGGVSPSYFTLWTVGSNGEIYLGNQVITPNQWFGWAYRYLSSSGLHQLWRLSGHTLSLYQSIVNPFTASPITWENALYTQGPSSPSISAAYYRRWDAYLTGDEMLSELLSPAVLRTAGLTANTPLLSNLSDISGNDASYVLGEGDAASFGLGPILVATKQRSDSGALDDCHKQPLSGGTGKTGDVLPPVTKSWAHACAGDGGVLQASDISDSESWS